MAPKSWLAFDLNVLRRLEFSSVALPFSDQPALGAYLKRWKVRVAANDPLQSAWARAYAQIATDGDRLTEDEVNIVLEDAYVPGYRLKNQALTSWFGETDAWWFDNTRRNIDKLPSIASKALAAALVIGVGDYVMGFKENTRELRQPLSTALRRMWSIQPESSGAAKDSTCQNKLADDFVSETAAELLFLRLPAAHVQKDMRTYLGRSAWREEWLRGGSDFWESFDAKMRGRLGSATETKSQYLHLLEETLRRAGHITNWAVAHVEDGFIQTQDIADTIGRIRRVETIYTKDFSELTGTKAVIITA